MTAHVERDRLIDIQERCRITGYGRSTTFEQVAKGKVKRYKVGKRALYSENEAFAEVAAIKAAAHAEAA
ncbi:MAG: hypothetical protein WKF52_03530 [Sphingomicrobium sp.]